GDDGNGDGADAAAPASCEARRPHVLRAPNRAGEDAATHTGNSPPAAPDGSRASARAPRPPGTTMQAPLGCRARRDAATGGTCDACARGTPGRRLAPHPQPAKSSWT